MKSQKYSLERSEKSDESPSNQKSPAVHRYEEIKFNDDIIKISDSYKPQGSSCINHYINYNKNKLLFQTGKIRMTYHGIVRLDNPNDKNSKGYYPTDDKREFIKIPLDPNQPSCMELHKFIMKWDDYFSQDSIKKKLFGKYADRYTYTSSIKLPDRDPLVIGEEKMAKMKDPVEYVRVKFSIEYMNKENKKITTKFIKIDSDTSSKEEIIVNTMTDVAGELNYNSEIRFIIHPAMLSIYKERYFTVYKVILVEYKQGLNNRLDINNVQLKDDEEDKEYTLKKSEPKASKAIKFSNSDDDDLPIPSKQSKNSVNTNLDFSPPKSKNRKYDEEEPKPKSKSKSNKYDSDDENPLAKSKFKSNKYDSDEEISTKFKASKFLDDDSMKKIKKSKTQDSDEEAPPKKSKKVVKKQSDECTTSESEEEVKPISRKK